MSSTSADYKPVIVIIVIFVIIVFIGLFWWFTAEKVVVEEPVKEQCHPDKSDIKQKGEIFTILITHRPNGEMDCRIMFPVTVDGAIYFYSPKESPHLKQIANDNRVTIFTHITEGKVEKQIVFSGKLIHEFDIENFSVHKFNITNRKISLSKTEGTLLITQKMFNGERIPETKIPIGIYQKVKDTIEKRKSEKPNNNGHNDCERDECETHCHED